jgi:NAD-dependent SIR2 family protein deacetylase
MPQYALQSGAKLVIINLGSTPLDSQSHLLIPGKAGEVMSLVITKVKARLRS